MEVVAVDRSKTFFYNDFLRDYFESDKFAELRTYRPTLNEVGKAIKAKGTFSSEKRETLVKVLSDQYKQAKIEIQKSAVGKNIDKLKSDKTFTVTTGQQIHIGLGPLYVIYKILDVIRIAKELNERHPEFNFIPVFWMATEDHDLDEIQRVQLFGKEFKWETTQSGAVGRMNTLGIPELFSLLQDQFRFSKGQLEFIELCKQAYLEQSTLADAFRQLIHHYFEKDGLVILDADNQELKQSFIPVMQDELMHRNADALEHGSSKLEELGYDRQLLVRDCNLFQLGEQSRTKILEKSNTNLTESEAFQLSPNAALRPFYQEWILPNLLYVGGGAEVKYWTQLKGLFDNYAFPMPIIQLRSSYILIPRKYRGEIVSQNPELLFKSDLEIGKMLSEKSTEKANELELSFLEVLNSIKKYEDTATKNLSGFSLAGKVKKIVPKINELKDLVDSQLAKDLKNNKQLNRILKVRDKFFEEQKIQERKEHVLQHIDMIVELSSKSNLSEFKGNFSDIALVFD